MHALGAAIGFGTANKIDTLLRFHDCNNPVGYKSEKKSGEHHEKNLSRCYPKEISGGTL
jgi:hypothetical protein